MVCHHSRRCFGHFKCGIPFLRMIQRGGGAWWAFWLTELPAKISIHDSQHSIKFCCSYHSFETTLKTASRCASMGYDFGAKATTNVDAYNVPNPTQGDPLAKNVLQTYAFGMFANLVASQGRGTIHCSSWWVASGNHINGKDSIFGNW